ncbi:MAG: hypothetical protein II680_05120 [Clostridia bacterium]|nr:hypothetical protein [Clostridia bacterium]
MILYSFFISGSLVYVIFLLSLFYHVFLSSSTAKRSKEIKIQNPGMFFRVFRGFARNCAGVLDKLRRAWYNMHDYARDRGAPRQKYRESGLTEPRGKGTGAEADASTVGAFRWHGGEHPSCCRTDPHRDPAEGYRHPNG